MTRFLPHAGIDRVPREAACGVTRLVLYGVESGVIGIPPMLARHRRGCLVCQAATVRQRQVIKGLASMRRHFEPLPYDMTVVLDQPMTILPESPTMAHDTRRRSVRAAVASAASLAAIGVVVIAGRWIKSAAGSQ